jgi:rhodanese-related sulfurtransferase
VAKPKPVIQLDDSTSTSPFTSEGPLSTMAETIAGEGDTAIGLASPPGPVNTERGSVRPTDPAVPIGQAPTSKPAQKNLYADVPPSEYLIEVGLAKAKELYDRGGLLVLDAREKAEFEEGHIRGAVSAPYDDVAGDLAWLERLGADTRPILCYCGGGECELSHDLGSELTRAGHRKVLVLKDGYPAWEEAGYPVEKGGAP